MITTNMFPLRIFETKIHGYNVSFRKFIFLASYIGKCQPDQIEIMNKCMWFECGYIFSSSMNDYCSQNFGALASFNEKSFENMTKYLRDIDADSSRKTDVSKDCCLICSFRSIHPVSLSICT